eukprot:4484144-Pyramimonas_sp.AAC.1
MFLANRLAKSILRGRQNRSNTMPDAAQLADAGPRTLGEGGDRIQYRHTEGFEIVSEFLDCASSTPASMHHNFVIVWGHD